MKNFTIVLFYILTGWFQVSCGRTKIVEVPLYEHGIPNEVPGKDEETIQKSPNIHHVWNVRKPTISVFLPPAGKANGTAVIICPGGGYAYISIDKEGYAVAEKFNELGITAFVLKYRLPDTLITSIPEIAPLQDVQQALKLVRMRAEEWQVNPAKVGVVGFSAGGHVASTAGTHFKNPVIPNPENINLRPDFLMLIYPVISGSPELAHKGSFDRLLVKNNTPEKIREYSNNLQVTAHTPPTFLVHASDDNAVKPENSINLYRALLRHKVPAKLHLYPAGGHGFGLKNPATSEEWLDLGKDWLEKNKFLPKVD